MATKTRKSLVGRAGAAARKVVSRANNQTAKTTKATAAKKTAATSTAEKTAAKKAAKKAATTKAATTKATTKAAPAKKTAAKKATATKKTATKAPAKKAPATKSAATKSTTKSAPKAPAKKTATKAAAPKSTATKAAPKKAAPKKAAPKKAAPKKTTAKKTTAKKTTAKKTTKKAAKRRVAPSQLVVLEQEDPWTPAELKEVRTQLLDDVRRLTGELAEVEEDLAGMIENSGEGAGQDQADVGSASYERDQEMVVVHNARDMLEQSQHALERIDAGSYGQCENCGNPIGKNRLMAFPRATLCLACKQREERR
jgi:RNA polymerase-binding protein DksA